MKNKYYARLLKKRFIRVLEKKRWDRYRVKEENLIIFGLQGSSTDTFQCFFDIALEQEYCVLYLRREQYIPEEYRSKISEYLSYVNYGMLLGNFEIDLQDGEVRYKTCLPAGANIGSFFSSLPSEKELLHIVNVSVATAVRYNKGIDTLLIDSNVTPEQVCMQVENRKPLSAAEIIAQIDKLTDDDKKLIEKKLREQECTSE